MIGDPDDLTLHPDVMRWLAAYARAGDDARDATVAAIFEEINGRLLRAEGEPPASTYEARVRAVVEQLPAALWSTDPTAARQPIRLGTWGWRRGDTSATWSPDLYRMWGLDPRTFQPTHDNVRSRIHPEDRATFDAIRASAIGTGRSVDAVFRVIRSDGEVGYLAGSMTATRDADGQLARLQGITLDVTERVHAERERAELRERQARLDVMLAAARELASRVSPGLAMLPDDPLAGVIGAAAALSKALSEIDGL